VQPHQSLRLALFNVKIPTQGMPDRSYYPDKHGAKMPICWSITHGNILDQPGDVLVCSANIFLNLSGGVGGELLRRCGHKAQEELHGYLKEHGLRFVQQGEVIVASPHRLPLKAVLHAVAIDGFYATTPEIVRATIDRSLHIAASLGARTVLMTALATGYGRLSLPRFAEAVTPLMKSEFAPVIEVVICVKNLSDQEELAAGLTPVKTGKQSK
jgi:O-acetyl-ADP-ribose deacetylase (regulator of RNase III)